MNWWQYLLLVNVYLVLFFGFYALLLRKETFFQLNRIYLVSAALLSFIIPVIQADWVKNLFITQTVHYSIYGKPLVIYQFKPIADAPFNIGQVLTVIYLAGVLFLMLRLVWQLLSLKRIINQPEQAGPYSFFKKIKMDEYTAGNDVIAAHEQVHAKQWHSADVLIVEAVMIINWFNPVVYFYRYAVKHIHEFIADSHALKSGTNKADYAMMLLTQTFNAPSHQLVNNFFNSSLLKQRIIMLQKSKSQRTALIKYGLSAPLFILMLILSSATVNNSKAVTGVNKIAQKVFAINADQSALSKITTVVVTPEDKTTKPKTVSTNKNGNAVTNGSPVSAKADTVPVKDSKVYNAVETEPEFPGGLDAFYEFLSKTIHYPPKDRERKVQGRTIVTFIVEQDGSLSNIKALRGPSESINAESVRAISLSPNWAPGLKNGAPVRVQYTVPVSFTLADDSIPAGKKTGVIEKSQKEDQSKTILFGSVSAKPDTNKNPVYRSIQASANGPRYIIDGQELKDNEKRMIISANIESVAVIKFTSGGLLYGKKAPNGVIVITMKKK
jgi:TonB family protein